MDAKQENKVAQAQNNFAWDLGTFLGAILWTGVVAHQTLIGVYMKGLHGWVPLWLALGWALTGGLWIMSISWLTARRIKSEQ